MYFHYWMVESEGNPATDPVIMWYNGGPGASSLFGMLQELGPLMLNSESYDAKYNKTGIPSPKYNPFTWAKHATLIALDSPPPIGFSYCTEQGPAAGGTSCGPWTDDTVFKANHEAHKTLFNKIFPELKPNPFFFAGESYAGIYVPGFANALMDDPIPGLNFKGFAVGDGWTGCPHTQPNGVDMQKAGEPANYCIDLDNIGLFKYPNANYGPFYDIEFFHGHGQFSEELYRQIKSSCPEAELRTPNLTATCLDLVSQMADEVGGFYAYNLYNMCPVGASKYGINKAMQARTAAYSQIGKGKGSGGDTDSGGDTWSGLPGNSPCPGSAMPEWLGLNATMDALGVPRDSNFLNLDNGHGFNYTSNVWQITPIYKRAISLGLRVLVYEGDTDACGLSTAPVEDVFVSYFNKNLGAETAKWRPWTTDGDKHMGGFVIQWKEGQAQFVSIRGSGHLAPLNRPNVVSTLLNTFVNNGTLPGYKK